jgi:hypothetical protein
MVIRNWVYVLPGDSMIRATHTTTPSTLARVLPDNRIGSGATGVKVSFTAGTLPQATAQQVAGMTTPAAETATEATQWPSSVA